MKIKVHTHVQNLLGVLLKIASAFLIFISLMGLSFSHAAKDEKPSTAISGSTAKLAYGLLSKPIKHSITQGILWGLDFLPTGELLIAERSGKLYIWDPKTKKSKIISHNFDVKEFGQSGLLDIKVHPDFQKNKLILWTQSVHKDGESTTALKAATLNEDKISNVRTIIEVDAWSSNNIHYGSRIAIDHEGFIFISIGDRNERDKAQLKNQHFGKILKIDLQGRPAPDNPFLNEKGSKPEIWSWGHRNPQGLCFDRLNRKLWSTEHGPRNGNEINLITKGLNYGWPRATGGREYWGPRIGAPRVAGTEAPVHEWTPSIAVSSLIIADGQKEDEPNKTPLAGALIAGALRGQHLQILKLTESSKQFTETRVYEDLGERIRALAISPSGTLYFGTDSGSLYQATE